ncbi:expressed unknown protein [Seminavis robusta]|uniref:HMG box domain-containing protein n=1 Tax=Seminavis robusta TaxID=568900 RepID=A0A9N8HSB7_9STRA|nr:expressed unknown protein [Seminavis robusta]|eukprot:Sro1698_g291950.1 n/a (519) ;mRNA; r:7484-9040
MACSNTSSSAAAAAANRETDPLAPLEWSMDGNSSSEDVSLALLNEVELEQDDDGAARSCSPYTNTTTNGSSNGSLAEGNNKRKRDEERNTQPQEQHYRSVQVLDHHNNNSSQTCAAPPVDPSSLWMTADERPRVSRRRKKKPKGLPKRPMNAYAIFYHQERLRMVQSLTVGSISEDDIQRQVGELWRDLPQDEIQKFEKMAEDDKVRYHEEMAAYHNNANNDSKEPLKAANNLQKDMRKDLEDDRAGHLTYDFPPPPPGVMVIPGGRGGGSGRESVASNASARRDSSSPNSPVPPPIASRWNNYQPPPPAMPQVLPPQAYLRPPSVASVVHSPSRGVGRMVQQPPHGGHYHQEQQYYHPPHPMPPASWGPPSPYSPRSAVRHLAPPPLPSIPSSNSSGRAYSPHISLAPAAAYGPPTAYSIPPGMEMALPTRTGGEQKYKVTYRCYTMRKEDLPSFMESLNASNNNTNTAASSRPAPVQRSESLPPRPASAYSSHHSHAPPPPAMPHPQPLIHHHPSW